MPESPAGFRFKLAPCWHVRDHTILSVIINTAERKIFFFVKKVSCFHSWRGVNKGITDRANFLRISHVYFVKPSSWLHKTQVWIGTKVGKDVLEAITQFESPQKGYTFTRTLRVIHRISKQCLSFIAMSFYSELCTSVLKSNIFCAPHKISSISLLYLCLYYSCMFSPTWRVAETFRTDNAKHKYTKGISV